MDQVIRILSVFASSPRRASAIRVTRGRR